MVISPDSNSPLKARVVVADTKYLKPTSVEHLVSGVIAVSSFLGGFARMKIPGRKIPSGYL